MGPPQYSGMGAGRNSSSSSDGLALPPVDTNAPMNANVSSSKDDMGISGTAGTSGSTNTTNTSSSSVSGFRSAETAVREVVVRTKSLFRGTDARTLLNGAAGAAASVAVSATRRRGSSDIFSRRRGEKDTNNGHGNNNAYRRVNSSGELDSSNEQNDPNTNGNNGNGKSFEDIHPERTKMNHHITLAGVRPPEGMSSSGLPAVRMSTLSNIVLPSTFHFEPLEDTTAVSSFTQAGGHSDTFRSNGPVLDLSLIHI